jgi:hypothetical protein
MIKAELFIQAVDPVGDGNQRVLAHQTQEDGTAIQMLVLTKDSELVKNMQAGKTLNVQITVKAGAADLSEEAVEKAGPPPVGSGFAAPVANDPKPNPVNE